MFWFVFRCFLVNYEELRFRQPATSSISDVLPAKDLEEEPFFGVVASLAAECGLRRERLQMGNNDWNGELHSRDLAAWEQLQMDGHDARMTRHVTETL